MEDRQVFTFKRVCDYKSQPKVINTVEIEAVTIPELMTEFEEFLRGCGFSIPQDEHLEFIKDEKETEE